MMKLYNETNVENIADAIRDRSGYEGKNLLNNTLLLKPVTKGGVTVSYENGCFVLNGTASSSEYFDVTIDYIYGNFNLLYIENQLKQETIDNYTLSANITNGEVNIGHNTNNGIWAINTRIGITYNNAILKIQLEKGTQATPYEPYDLKYKIRDMAGAIKELPNQKLYEKALANQVSEEATGNPVYLENSADMPFKKLEVQGNTEQESYTGKNLLNIEDKTTQNAGLTFISHNGKIDISGTPTNTYATMYTINEITLKAGTYSVSKNITTNGLELWFKGAKIATLFSSENSKSFTISEEKTGKLEITLTGLTTGSAITKNQVELMLEQGSTATTYEPYVGGTASPNPEYPQEIKCVGQNGSASVKVQNRNLYKFYSDLSGTVYKGVTVSIKDNILTLNGTATGDMFLEVSRSIGTVQYETTPYKKLDTSKSYTLSLKDISGEITNGDLQFVIQFDNNNNIALLWKSRYPRVTFSNSDGIYRGWIYYSNGAVFNNYKFSIQLEEGTKETEYTPHQEQTFTIPVQQEMCKIGDVKDRFTRIGGKWFEEHNVGKVVLDGNEDWRTHYSGDWGSVCYLTYSEIKKDCKILSDYFSYLRNMGDLQTEKAIGKIAPSSWSDSIIYLGSANSNATVLKQWLSEHKPEVYYQLETPSLIECTEEQSIILNKLQEALTYQGGTHVSATSENANPMLDVEYFVDINEIMPDTMTLELNDKDFLKTPVEEDNKKISNFILEEEEE